MIAGPVLEVVRSNLCEATKPARAKDEEREKGSICCLFIVLLYLFIIFLSARMVERRSIGQMWYRNLFLK